MEVAKELAKSVQRAWQATPFGERRITDGKYEYSLRPPTSSYRILRGCSGVASLVVLETWWQRCFVTILISSASDHVLINDSPEFSEQSTRRSYTLTYG